MVNSTAPAYKPVPTEVTDEPDQTHVHFHSSGSRSVLSGFLRRKITYVLTSALLVVAIFAVLYHNGDANRLLQCSRALETDGLEKWLGAKTEKENGFT